jgi:SAM-dependent methyltransferase
MPRSVMLRRLAESPEGQQIAPHDALMSLHRSRMLFVQSLPRAGRILDLGGVSLQSDDGALVSLGYPYSFDHLAIVDLPPEDRHELYRGGTVDHLVESPLGPVSYRYHSMADLAGIADGSIDLVYSGQTFEHVSPEDGRSVLDEVHRVLRPGAQLALDTPNRTVTAIQLRDEPMAFIDPDHEVEYTHAEMLALFDAHGFVVERAHGLNLCAAAVDADAFSLEELAAHPGLFADLDRCYLLAYVVRRPE